MTSPRYLLDTDTFVYIRRARPAHVLARFERLKAGEAVLSVITYGELLYGIEKKKMGAEPMQRLQELVSFMPVMPLPVDAARTYGVIRAALAATGDMIGSNDLWIAAHAITANLTLVSNNEREFRRVADLSLQNWVSE